MSWDVFQQKLRAKLSESVFQENFSGIRLLESNEQRVVVEVPNSRDLRQLTRLYRGLMELAWHEATGRSLDMELRHPADTQTLRPGPAFLNQSSVRLQPNFNFETFVVGTKSQFAYSAAFAVAQQPGGTKYNPLLIYGGSGLGKTHLAQAIGNYVLEGETGKAVCYVSAEEFSVQYVHSLQAGRMQEFTHYYRNEVDILLMDDIQFLSGRVETQNEFFHIFNTLHQAGKQVVLTSDAPPSEVKDLQDRLVTRFQWGLCVDIQPPELETREAILRKKAEIQRLNLSAEVIHYLAANIQANVRLLEGALNKLMLLTSLNKTEPDITLAHQVVSEIVPLVKRRVSIDSIIAAVAKRYAVEEDRILEGGRGTKEVAHARQVTMFLMKELTHMTLKSIGKRLGDRDHSTVVHAIKTVQKLMDDDPAFCHSIETLRSSIHD